MDKRQRVRFLIMMMVCSLLLSGCLSFQENNDINDEIDGYVKEELWSKREEHRIYGQLYKPNKIEQKIPAIIYSHGFGGNYEYGIQYARRLSKMGYAVYCFDFCGGSYSSQSDGSPLEMSIFTEQKDLEAVITTIQSLDFIDQNQIFLLGTSQGSVVSAITAASNKEMIKGMILLYPAFVLVDNAQELFKNGDDIPENYYHMWMNVGKVYFEDLLDYDVYNVMSLYDKDVLIIHGDHDDIVPLAYSQKAVETYTKAKLEVIEGAGHGFYGNDFEEAMQYIKNNLIENTK